MARKSIVIGTPTFGTISTRWAFAFRALATPMNSICPYVCEKGFEVGVARNRIVKIALGLDTKPSHIFWLDDDVLPHPYAILQLLQAEKDIIAGIYFAKGDYPEPIQMDEKCGATVPYVPDSGIHRRWGIAGGLTLVRTDVYRVMQERLDLGTDDGGNPRWYYTSGDKPDESYRCTEDMWFSEKAGEAGFEKWVDTSSRAFGWHFDLGGDYAHPRPQWEQYLKTGTADWEVPDGPTPNVPMSPDGITAEELACCEMETA